jgi:UPF0716 protein FxsA
MLAILAYGGLELWLLVNIGQLFGTWVPVLGVFGGLVLGGLVIRHAGLRSIERLRDAVRNGTAAGGHAAVGLAGVVAGILFIIPGFISDILALFLLMRWSRTIFFQNIIKHMSVRMRTDFSPPAPHGLVIDLDAVEISSEPEFGFSAASPWRRDSRL